MLYPFSIWYVCKLDSWAHIQWTFNLALKLGVPFNQQSQHPERAWPNGSPHGCPLARLPSDPLEEAGPSWAGVQWCSRPNPRNHCSWPTDEEMFQNISSWPTDEQVHTYHIWVERDSVMCPFFIQYLTLDTLFLAYLDAGLGLFYFPHSWVWRGHSDLGNPSLNPVSKRWVHSRPISRSQCWSINLGREM
jgi:hypothetical protein